MAGYWVGLYFDGYPAIHTTLTVAHKCDDLALDVMCQDTKNFILPMLPFQVRIGEEMMLGEEKDIPVRRIETDPETTACLNHFNRCHYRDDTGKVRPLILHVTVDRDERRADVDHALAEMGGMLTAVRVDVGVLGEKKKIVSYGN